MTAAQLFVLKIIADADRVLTIGEVAHRTLTDQSTVSVVAGRLVARGFVRRKRSQRDSRCVYLTLTEKGRAAHRKAPATVASGRLAGALAGLSQSEASTLHSMLDDLTREMGADHGRARMMFDEEDERAGRSGARATEPASRRRQ